MLKIRNKLYFRRFREHLTSLDRHLREGDYVQAAEKVWGAMSSFINAVQPNEVRRVEDKKYSFKVLFDYLSVKNPHLEELLSKHKFKNIDEFTTKASGLHEFFYGGRNYSEEYLRGTIAGCAAVLKAVLDVIEGDG